MQLPIIRIANTVKSYFPDMTPHRMNPSLPLPLITALAATFAPLHATPWFDGGDLSALAKIEQLGGKFQSRDGTETDAIRALASYGANCVRLRLFVEPHDKDRFVVNDLPYTLALAKRAKAAGQTLLLDFHYSDTWADPAHQGIPKSWSQDSLEALVAKVESYTRETLVAFEKEGVFPELVQIGNEIDNGLLWPVGQIWKSGAKTPDWDSAAALFKAASRGVRGGTPAGKHTRIVLHTATGGNVGKTSAFHQEMQKRGLDYDVAGLSYYPWWHGTLDELKENTRQLVTRFHKEVLVAEAGFVWRKGGKESDKEYLWPASPEGQAAFLRDVMQVIHDLPEGKGIGVLWWHPDSVAVTGQGVWMSGNCALWQPDGTPLPAMENFRRY